MSAHSCLRVCLFACSCACVRVRMYANVRVRVRVHDTCMGRVRDTCMGRVYLSVFLPRIASPIVREVLRSGDIQSFAFTSSDHGDPIASISSLTEVIRNHEYILIVVVRAVWRFFSPPAHT